MKIISGINAGWIKYTGFICILLLGIFPVPSFAESFNIVSNPGFESGTASWIFFTNGAGTLLNDVPGSASPRAGHIAIFQQGTNVQLYQGGIVLEPGTEYKLIFNAYSNTGHDIDISLFKHGSPYTNYGLSNRVVNLGTSWNEYSIQFNTSGFPGNVNDGRLMFGLAPYDAAGDQYFIDNIILLPAVQFEPDTTPPNITLWYGNSQRFGQIGVPQQWVNILGNVYDSSGLSSLNYSLNDGNATNLSIGPDYRLESSGDFNVEINYTDLLCGDNQLVIKALDTQGNSRIELVSFNFSCNNVWPQNYDINWSNTASIQDVAQIADGLWIKEANSIRPAIIGYDRLITIGDMNWNDFEITAPVTINSPLDPTLSFGGPNFGFITRWQGHFPWDASYPAEWIGKQPNGAWYPLGGLGVYIWDASIRDFRLEIIGNRGDIIALDTSGKHLEVGIPYMFKMRAETIGTQSRYSLKVWQKNTIEPSGWTISGYGVAGELKRGSVTLGAHNANVSFGDVNIRSLSVDGLPVISDVSVESNEFNATVRWITDKPASSNVSYGLGIAYENGSVIDGTKVISHVIRLDGLQPGTMYHYRINSTDTGGRSTNTADMNFITRALTPPGIIVQPVNRTVIIGSAATFSVEASGTAPLSYQWQKNGVNITTATGHTYTTPVTNLPDSGTNYRVLVSNMYGSVTSNSAVLTVSEIINRVNNGDFEMGTTSWSFYTSGAGAFSMAIPGYEGTRSAQLALSNGGTNIQLYQDGITLEANTRYRLTFAAYSTTGHDVTVNLIGIPYAYYGLAYTANLGTSWQTFTTEFTTKGFTGTVSNGRLQFWLAPFAGMGDTYFIDNVLLGIVVDTPPQPPVITGKAPTGTNVPIAAMISLNFSNPMDHASVQSSFFTIPATNGSFSWSGNSMTYMPDSILGYDTTYNVMVGTGAQDSGGRNMLSSYTWEFTTMERDVIPPEIIENFPTGTNVPTTTQIIVKFSEEVNKSSAESAFSTLPDTTGGSFNWSGNTMRYSPPMNLFYNTTYSVTVGTGARDLAGNNLQSQYIRQFTTVPFSINILSNPGFESGTASWSFYADGSRSITLVSPGYEGNNAAKLAFTSNGANIQLYQNGITLEPNTRYRMTFDGYSNTGHDVTVNLIGIPYALYGLAYTANLGTSWQTFTTEFTTKGFTGTVNDARFQFWLTPFVRAGDIYYIDDIRLEKI